MQLGSLPYFLEQVLFMDSRQCRLSSGHPAHFHQLGLLKLWALPVDILGNTNAPANLSRFSECLRQETPAKAWMGTQTPVTTPGGS